MRTKFGWIFFAHHINLVMGEGGSQYINFENLFFLMEAARLTWMGWKSKLGGTLLRQNENKNWVDIFSHHINLIMGEEAE